MIGYLAAMIWSLTYGILESSWAMRGMIASDPSYPPVDRLMESGYRTGGLLGVFVVMWVISGIMWIVYQKSRRLGG